MFFFFIPFIFLYLIWGIFNSNNNYHYDMGISTRTNSSKNVLNYIYSDSIITNINYFTIINKRIQPQNNKNTIQLIFSKHYYKWMHVTNNIIGISSKITNICHPSMAPKSSCRGPNCRVYGTSRYSSKTWGIWNYTFNVHNK